MTKTVRHGPCCQNQNQSGKALGGLKKEHQSKRLFHGPEVLTDKLFSQAILVSNLHDVVVTAYKRTLHIRTALGCQNVSFKAMETEAPRGEEICMETIQVGENTTVQSPNSCCTCT
ncbi:hypothetical protein Y1Q_0009996 [Alligator mississippiensis]|uniref:Uncharacterized protein n=1 Tax=Alligator mississippiensis TaxID=8496 RepID=A0A151MLE2_ALLMI|nr:hypothetical protein Y1Q_0009996 [Alligator mississippiensis]